LKSIFPGHFRPTTQEFDKIWEESIFIVDANVLLNLYRYSDTTRSELEKALSGVSDRIFITHQAAKEFLKNRLSVTSGQSKEYSNAVNTINDLIKRISSKDRHPFIESEKLKEFSSLAKGLIENLEAQKEELLKKLTEDEILDFIQNIFNGKTGVPFSNERNEEVRVLGKERYELKIPPGYKDSDKDSSDDPLRKYGDLVVWLQSIEYSKDNDCSVVFITDDKKEDWWLEQAGRTIGPRPELIEEFKVETGFDFWMYSVSKFLQETATRNSQEVSSEVYEEIDNVREFVEKITNDIKSSIDRLDIDRSINVTQQTEQADLSENYGVIRVSLMHDMRYATGSGKFSPRLRCVPEFEVKLIEMPEGASEDIGISYGCGTNRDFNVHLKARQGQKLSAGSYVFQYVATCENDENEIDD
jgi:hypothetical protein